MTIPWGTPPEQPKYEPPEGYKLVKIKPFYQRPVFWVALVAIAVIAIVASVKTPKGSEAANSAPSATQVTVTTTVAVTSAVVAPVESSVPESSVAAVTSRSISQGFGSKDATADVVIGALTADKIGDTVMDYYVPVTVTNPTDERANYYITLALESADGAEQIDTASLFITNLEGGQVKKDKGIFFEVDELPAGAKVVAQEIQRTAA